MSTKNEIAHLFWKIAPGINLDPLQEEMNDLHEIDAVISSDEASLNSSLAYNYAVSRI